MRFKTEIFLLLVAIVLFTASAFLYSYEAISKGLSFALELYPYRDLAISFVGFGSALMIAASISYSERSKNPI
ncbi:MAG TPA: hypothetical protein VI864_05445 [Candidatus Bathyarchaeia archaeon]|nr:hypothetical protein [Candidatus Bathyarchaeia archaeon]